MTFLSSGLLRLFAVFILLFTLTVPFPTYVLPSAGAVFEPVFIALNQWSALHLWGITGKFTPDLVSDSTGLYLHLVHLGAISLLLSLVWLRYFKNAVSDMRILYLLQLFSAYLLAFFLFKYGFEKVFKHQFYLPEPNTLFTPVGYLSQDILFWTTIGSSYSYSVFLGALELIPALLLLSRRTRLFGALLAFGVLAHVLVINLSFDISVKVLSAYLLLLSVLVLIPYRRQLIAFFWLRNTQIPPHSIASFEQPKTTVQRLLKATVAGLILFESLFLYFNTGNFNDDLAVRPRFHGAYVVTATTGNAVSPSLGSLADIQRIFIHRRGYVIIQHRDGSMQDYKAFFSGIRSRISIWHRGGKLDLAIACDTAQQKCRFSWEENRQAYVLEVRKTDLQQLPLLQPAFHLTIDDYH